MDYQEKYQQLKMLYDKVVADKEVLASELKEVRQQNKEITDNCHGYIKELQKTLYEAMLEKEAYKRLNDELGLVLREIRAQS